MKKNVYLIGAGGHVRSLINTLELDNFKINGIYDDNYKAGEKINGYKLIGRLADIKKDDILILAIGDNNYRSQLFFKYAGQIYKQNIVHPSAMIEKRVILKLGNQLFADVYINSNACIGNNNILNTSSIIEHEVVIGDHNHISVGAIICGRAIIGNRCFVGAGSVVINELRVCDDVVIGANSVVVDSIATPGKYAGNPAKKIR